MKKKFIAIIALVLICMEGFSQNGESHQFKPSGKPFVKIFSDFRTDLQDGNSDSGFELSRSYFGYSYHFAPHFSGKVEFDVTTSNNSSGTFPSAYTAFLKNAYGEYHNGIVKIGFGLLGTNAFHLQESIWSKRYLLKSFQDLNKFSSSADIGISLKVKATPQLELDAQILNGEGYKKIQADSTLKFATEITYTPVSNVFIRIYGDYLGKNKTLNTANQSTFNAFAGYKGETFTFGGEYNYQKGHSNIKDHNLSGLSVYGTYKASKIISAFARYDYLTSNTISGESSGWNETSSGDNSLYVAGIEFLPAKGIAISPNVQISDFKQSTAKDIKSLMLNLSFKF